MSRIFNVSVASVYPHYRTKVERKGRTQEELDAVICWLTGYDEAQLQAHLAAESTFTDFFALRDLIASKSNAFARSFSEALIEFALGRPIGFRDEPLIDEMISQAGKKDLALREFIHALVRSREFRTK